jgi:hypothetical protein
VRALAEVGASWWMSCAPNIDDWLHRSVLDETFRQIRPAATALICCWNVASS